MYGPSNSGKSSTLFGVNNDGYGILFKFVLYCLNKEKLLQLTCFEITDKKNIS